MKTIANVCLLPAKDNNQREYPCILKYGHLFGEKHSKLGYYDCNIRTPTQLMHLYITLPQSDLEISKIKEGEILPYIMKWENEVELFNSNSGIRNSKLKRAEKIIATTDNDLTAKFGSDGEFYGKMKGGIPSIPQQFIEYYINEYNKGNVISSIEIELDEEPVQDGDWKRYSSLKLNQQNEICIVVNEVVLRRKIYNHGFYDYYYKCQKCKCESISLKHLGGFQSPNLICDNCGARVLNNKIQMEETTRELALEWWNNLSIIEKSLLAQKYSDTLFGGKFTSLTDREIEEIWEKEDQIKKLISESPREWWDNLPVWGIPSKEYYMGLYYSDDTVTDERIEAIWRKEGRVKFSLNHDEPQVDFEMLKETIEEINSVPSKYLKQEHLDCINLFFNLLSTKPTFAKKAYEELNKLNK